MDHDYVWKTTSNTSETLDSFPLLPGLLEDEEEPWPSAQTPSLPPHLTPSQPLVHNALWFPADRHFNTLAFENVVTSEVEVGSGRATVGPLVLPLELLTTNLGPSAQPRPATRRPVPILPRVVPQPPPQTHSQDQSEDKKREIALEALAELKAQFRRHRGLEDLPDTPNSRPASTIICKICQAKFTTSSSLRVHYRSHAGVKPFRCGECGTRFTRRHSLRYHTMCHTNKTAYLCPHCPKTFRHPAHFKDHVRLHRNELFVCPTCQYGFRNRTTLRRHMNLSHPLSSPRPPSPLLLSPDALTVAEHCTLSPPPPTPSSSSSSLLCLIHPLKGALLHPPSTPAPTQSPGVSWNLIHVDTDNVNLRDCDLIYVPV